MTTNSIILIVYTTEYKDGGREFKKVAQTIANETAYLHREIYLEKINKKVELIDILSTIERRNLRIEEFHFVGHSGMYGPMFGKITHPEQFSLYELKRINFPFTRTGKAYFHSCRSARWFAPMFAKVFNVRSYGYNLYTTISSSRNRFIDPRLSNGKDLYLVGSPGLKSHGIFISLFKRLGLVKAERFKSFDPGTISLKSAYDGVAEKYAQVFSDITVRQDEFEWLTNKLDKLKPEILLDIGCGNGSLLKEISSMITRGIGIDSSAEMIEQAKGSIANITNISFTHLDSVQLPLKDKSVDVIVSLLSFRYLDWDPIVDEFRRVCKPGAKVLIVDMVAAPISYKELPKLLFSKLKFYWSRYKNPTFHKQLNGMVNSDEWKEMLKFNPIRSQEELYNYTSSRFRMNSFEILNIGLHSRVVAIELQC